jgi:hypothetical protein
VVVAGCARARRGSRNMTPARCVPSAGPGRKGFLYQSVHNPLSLVSQKKCKGSGYAGRDSLCAHTDSAPVRSGRYFLPTTAWCLSFPWNYALLHSSRDQCSHDFEDLPTITTMRMLTSINAHNGDCSPNAPAAQWGQDRCSISVAGCCLKGV